MKKNRMERLEKAYGLPGLLNGDKGGIAAKLLDHRFAEDAGRDITIEAVLPQDLEVEGMLLAKEKGVLAGLSEVLAFYKRHSIVCKPGKKDGDRVKKGDCIARLKGLQSELLKVERTGLNFLQRLSGVATLTRHLNKITSRHGVRVVGTRKTLFNALEKKAIALGGGLPHRYSLQDAVLIKDNHLSAIGLEEKGNQPVVIALERAYAKPYRTQPRFIEIEAADLESAILAAETFARLMSEAGKIMKKNTGQIPFIIMLDNMKASDIRATVKLLKKKNLHDLVLLEASGGITEANLEKYAATGVDAISIGAVTHSVRALDISQKIIGPLS